jgi:hypothetical protein
MGVEEVETYKDVEATFSKSTIKETNIFLH